MATARGLSVFVNIGAKLLPSLNSTASSVEKRFGQMGKRLRVQAAETKIAMKEMSAAMSPLLGMAAAGGLAMSLKGIIGEGSQYTHQISQMKNMGRSVRELGDAMRQAQKTATALPTSTLVDNLKVLNETTMAFGSFKHATDNLTFVQKMEGMLSNVLGDKAGESGDSAYSLIKAMETRGMGTRQNKAFDSSRFQREAGMFYQASIASSGRVSPQELLSYTQMANPANKSLSDRFLYRVAPTLIQEYGGDRAGTQQSAWTNTIQGKAKSKISTEAWMALGLLDPKGIVSNKVGPVGWKPGAIKGTDLALRDPLAWSEQVLIPALRAHGFDTSNQLSLAKAMIPLFRNTNANRLATTLVSDQDRARIHNDERNINQAVPLNGAYRQALKNDPTMAWKATSAALTNLETTLGRVGSPTIAAGLNGLASGLRAVAGVFDRHPGFAKGALSLLALGTGMAVLKTFGIALRWVLSPLRLLGTTLLWLARSRLGGIIANALIRLGPIALRALTLLGPWILRGVAAAFGLLSNPIGWAILVVSAGLLIWHFRAAIARAWHSVTAWFTTTAWPSIKRTVMAVNWRSIGMAIADAMTFGLASRLPAMLGAAQGALGLVIPWFKPATPAPGLAGKRATGGPMWAGMSYLVGERGPEIVTPGRSGYVHTARASRGMVGGGAGGFTHNGDIIIQAANDPHATARAVRHELRKMAGGQSSSMSD